MVIRRRELYPNSSLRGGNVLDVTLPSVEHQAYRVGNGESQESTVVGVLKLFNAYFFLCVCVNALF